VCCHQGPPPGKGQSEFSVVECDGLPRDAVVDVDGTEKYCAIFDYIFGFDDCLYLSV